MTTSSYAFDQFEAQTDVGSVHHPGSCAYDPERQIYTITGAGANIWGDHDDFHFVWRRMRGNFSPPCAPASSMRGSTHAGH